jgi:putative ABC transport system permease protein
MMLLAGAGLLMRSFLHLSAVEPGFDPKDVVTMTISIPRIQPGRSVTARQLLDRVRALPPVLSASIASDYPFSGDSSAIRYSAEDQPVTDAQISPRAYRHDISPEFFSTLRVPFVAGRTFTEAEMDRRADVVIVSEDLAKRFWSGQDPIGRRIKAGGPTSANPWWTIVGVVREMKFRGLPNNPTADPDIFFPLSQQPTMTMLVRSSAGAAHVPEALRRAIHEVDSSIVVFDVATMPERIGRYMERPRFSSWIMGIFAALALTLASVGLYAVMAYIVRQRTREFGIRMAMGATSGEVTRMVIRKGMLLVAAGITIGVLFAHLLASALGALLFGVSETDPQTFIGVAGILSAVALSACYLPARRASRVDPVTALRYE